MNVYGQYYFARAWNSFREKGPRTYNQMPAAWLGEAERRVAFIRSETMLRQGREHGVG